MLGAPALSLAPVRTGGLVGNVSIVSAAIREGAAIGLVASLLGGLVPAIRFRHEAG